MTPLLAALSSSFVALRSAVAVVAASPLSAASRKRRTAVFSSDFTALLRSRRRSLVRLRLICDLMLATRDLPRSVTGAVAADKTTSDRAGAATHATMGRVHRPAHRSRPHPEFLHHRPHRPRQVDAGG